MKKKKDVEPVTSQSAASRSSCGGLGSLDSEFIPPQLKNLENLENLTRISLT